MRELFSADPRRFQKFSCEHAGLFLDYSKNRVTDATLELLFALAREAGVEDQRDALFRGELLGADGTRTAAHPALRDDGHGPAAAAGRTDEALADRARMHDLCKNLRSGRHTGFSGKPPRDVVSLGIGGSHLGPATVAHALKHLGTGNFRVFFVAGPDARGMSGVLDQIDPERVLFIVTSKMFTTRETLANAERARDWINRRAGDGQAWRKHFLAVTSDVAAAARFGISPDGVLRLWDDVSGRFSLWSSVGLPLALLFGSECFEELLAGARSMDAHFARTPLVSNMPVILALLDVWYINFHGIGSRAVLPYDYALERLPGYLQQLEMESNGKSVDRDGRALNYMTAPVVWGQSGPEGQHSFYQVLHQGGRLVPSDFIITASGVGTPLPYDELLRVNFLAQTHALMYGDDGGGDPQRFNRGNQPSNALVLDSLSPFTLGALLALYEHKVFVQAAIWNVNPFDQWGVELGKRIAAGLFSGDETDLDSSTTGLAKRLRHGAGRRGPR